MSREKLKGHRYTYPIMNLGNTCYLNSTLQCLLATAPLINFFHTQQHQEFCQKKQACTLCSLFSMVNHIQKFKQTDSRYIINDLRRYWKNFRVGKQEDSQELLQKMIDQFIRSCFKNYEFGSKYHMEQEQHTTLFKIFCGKTRSRVHCLGCDYKSDTLDNQSVLTLEIPREVKRYGFYNFYQSKKAQSLHDLLKNYVQPEILTNNNKYHCKNCKKLQKAEKTMTIHETPRILIISFKKYDCQGNKIQALVDYPQTLNLYEYTSAFKDKNGDSQTGKQTQKHQARDNKSEDIYDLYGMIMHHGADSRWGHYTSIVKDYNGAWIRCDDDRISTSQQLSSTPYILFYQKRTYVKVQSQQTKINSLDESKNSDASTTISPLISCDEKEGQKKQTQPQQNGPKTQKEEEKVTEFKVPLPQQAYQKKADEIKEKLKTLSMQTTKNLNEKEEPIVKPKEVKEQMEKKEVETVKPKQIEKQNEEEKEDNILFSPERNHHQQLTKDILSMLTFSLKNQQKKEQRAKSVNDKDLIKIEKKDLKSISMDEKEIEFGAPPATQYQFNGQCKNFQRIHKLLHPKDATKTNMEKKRRYAEFLKNSSKGQDQDKNNSAGVDNKQIKKRKINN